MKKKFKTSQRPAKSLQWPLRLLLGFSLSATQWVVANKVADMVADMEVDMVADMEVDMVAYTEVDMVVDMEVDMVTELLTGVG